MRWVNSGMEYKFGVGEGEGGVRERKEISWTRRENERGERRERKQKETG